MDKAGLIQRTELSSIVFLGLNHIMNRTAALFIVTLVVGFSASLLLFAFLSFILIWLPDHVRSGIANYSAKAMFLIAIKSAFMLAVGWKTDDRSNLIVSTSALIVIATMSGLFFLLINGLEMRLLFSTIALVSMPLVAILEYYYLLRLGYSGVKLGNYSSALVLFGAPLLWTYMLALFSSLTATSVRTAILLFRSREVALKPFGTACVFLGFLAALVEFAFIQARFFLGS
jgi:hypothetical protein